MDPTDDNVHQRPPGVGSQQAGTVNVPEPVQAVNAPAPVHAAQATNTGRRLALVELFERDGRMARTVDVLAWPLTIGRAIDNDIVLDDAYVAPRHARVAPGADGSLQLQVLASRNGVAHDGKHLADGESLALPAAGATLQIGGTRLRLRLPGEVVAPEKLLPGIVPGQRAKLAGMALLLLALVVAGQWVGLDPGTDTSAWLPMVMGLPLALAGWCGVWALVSKLFQHRFDFSGHLRIAIPWLLLMTLCEQLLPQLAAGLGWPLLWQLSGAVQAVLGALLVRAHLLHVLPQHPRAVTAAVAGVLVAGSAISLAVVWRANDSLFAAPYMSTLPLPALRLAGTVPVGALVQDMAPLADKLARRAKKARDDDADDGEAPAGDDSDE